MKGAKKVSVSRTIGAELDQRAKRAGVSREELMSMTEAEVSARVSSKMQAARAKHLGVSVEEYKAMTKAEREINLREVRSKEEDERRKKWMLASAARLMSEKGVIPRRTAKQEDRSVDLQKETPATDREFIRKVQGAAIHSVETGVEGRGGKNVSKAPLETTHDQVRIEFDKIYKPFVYKVLLASKNKDGLGFSLSTVRLADKLSCRIPFKNGISGEDVYLNVWLKLFGRGGVLSSFDVTREFVGKGAFRDYLRSVVKSTYYSMIRREMMTEKDVHGHVLYKKDCNGKYLLDKRGKRIPRLIPRQQPVGDENLMAQKLVDSGVENALDIRKMRSIFRRRLNVYYLAYLAVHDASPKTGWFYAAATEIFENAVPKDQVLDKCLKNGAITKRGSFDTALSRFRDAVNEKYRKLMKVILGADEVLSEEELIDLEWSKLAKELGKDRVDVIRHRIMKAMVDNFEEGHR